MPFCATVVRLQRTTCTPLRYTAQDAGLDFKRDKGSVLEAAVMYIHDLEERQRACAPYSPHSPP